MAGGAYDRLYELGFEVGKDIAIVGYDNREMASYEKPPLTTMGIPLHDIGYCAREVIMDLLQKKELKDANETHYVQCIPFIRESVNRIES